MKLHKQAILFAVGSIAWAELCGWVEQGPKNLSMTELVTGLFAVGYCLLSMFITFEWSEEQDVPEDVKDERG